MSKYPNLKERHQKDQLHEWRLYEDNIIQLYRNRRLIIQNEEMFFATTPLKIYTLPDPVYLGFIVRAWNEDVYNTVCPTCGDRALIFSFAGSPMTGSSSRTAICLGCGTGSHSRSSDFNILTEKLRLIIEQYTVKPLVGCTMEEVIAMLKS